MESGSVYSSQDSVTAESHAEVSHTPGPWVAGHEVKLEGRSGTYRQITEGPVTGMGSDIVAWACVAHPYNHDLHRHGEANARLIAAAPELLEACKEMKQLLDMVLCVTGGLPPDANGPAAKALAAIRKATGESA